MTVQQFEIRRAAIFQSLVSEVEQVLTSRRPARTRFTGFKFGNRSPVRVVETGQVFHTVEDAAQWVKSWRGKANRNCIVQARNKGSTAYGYHWRRVDAPDAEQPIREPGRRQIRRESDGKIFASITEACGRGNRVEMMRLRRAMKRGQDYQGSKWSFVEQKEQYQILRWSKAGVSA